MDAKKTGSYFHNFWIITPDTLMKAQVEVRKQGRGSRLKLVISSELPGQGNTGGVIPARTCKPGGGSDKIKSFKGENAAFEHRSGQRIIIRNGNMEKGRVVWGFNILLQAFVEPQTGN